MPRIFSDRTEAGHQLAARLQRRALPPPRVVYALPRGGVPVAAEVARALGAPLDLLLVRKIGAPGQPELALAAVVDGDHPQTVVDEEVRALTGSDDTWIAARARELLPEIERRRRVYLGDRAAPSVRGGTAIVVDDGIATGTSMRAALRALRARQPARVLLAVPVAPADTLAALRAEVDEVECLATPEPFYAVGAHYADFHQVEDDEVVATLAGFSAGGA